MEEYNINGVALFCGYIVGGICPSKLGCARVVDFAGFGISIRTLYYNTDCIFGLSFGIIRAVESYNYFVNGFTRLYFIADRNVFSVVRFKVVIL